MGVQFDEQDFAQQQYSSFDSGPKGISGWLIEKGIASDESSANRIMVVSVVVLLLIIITVLIFFRGGSPEPLPAGIDLPA